MESVASLTRAVQWIGDWLPFALLVSTRVAITLLAMPAPFGSLSPAPVRALTSLMIAAILIIAYGPARAPVPVEGVRLLGAAIGESMIGGVIGLTVRMTLAVAEVAGALCSQVMGLGFATMVEPNYGETAAPPARLLAYLSMVIFFVFEGHHAVLAALGASIRIAPPGQVFDQTFRIGALLLGGRMIGSGLRIAAPVLATMLILNMGIALASRAAPKVHIMYLSFAVSICGGVLILFVAAPTLAGAIIDEVRELPSLLATALGGR